MEGNGGKAGNKGRRGARRRTGMEGTAEMGERGDDVPAQNEKRGLTDSFKDAKKGPHGKNRSKICASCM